MVISDLNIICLRQKEKQIFENPKVGVDSYDLKGSEQNLYGDHWKLLTALQGYWYSLYPIKPEAKEYDYANGFFNIKPSRKSKVKFHVSLSSMNMELLSEVLGYYLCCSPIKQICFLARLDWEQENIICGAIKKKDFLKRLNDGKLFFNEAYIIKE